MKDLTTLRKQIDDVDSQIYTLIKQRAELAHEVGEVKKSAGDNAFYKPEREAQVLQNIIDKNDSLLRDKDIAYIFRQIMSACLALEQPLTIAYLGPVGTWSGEAALKHFGNGVEITPCSSIDRVFSQITKNNADYGVVPIENSSNGTVTATVNSLHSHNHKICGEVEVRIQHTLLGKTSDTSNITKIVAHQQALDQCSKYLQKNYPNTEKQAVESNGLAAKMASQTDGILAIASENAQTIYNLEPIAKNIEDSENNTTRFLVIGNEEVGISGNDKTSILITTKHESGTLYDVLTPFKKNQINLLKLDSYPNQNHGNWQYLFLIDFVGHINEPAVQTILDELNTLADDVQVLGSYPVAPI